MKRIIIKSGNRYTVSDKDWLEGAKERVEFAYNNELHIPIIEIVHATTNRFFITIQEALKLLNITQFKYEKVRNKQWERIEYGTGKRAQKSK